jgi:hypothetical protein
MGVLHFVREKKGQVEREVLAWKETRDDKRDDSIG